MCDDPETGIIYVLVPNGTDPVDETTIVTGGTAGLTFIEVVAFGGAEKVCFEVDFTVGGTFTIDLETDAAVSFFFSGEIDPYVPLDLDDLDWTISPDCGDGTGVISFSGGSGQVVEADLHFPNNGSELLNEVLDLSADTYAVLVSDIYCPIDTLIGGIVVPDGSLSVDFIDLVHPVACVNEDSTATGMVPGKIVGNVSGGSDDYSVDYLPLGGSTTSGYDIAYLNLYLDGSYTITVIDNVSGCALIETVELVMGENNFEINLEEVIPIVVNSFNTLQEGSIEVSVTTDNNFGLISYTWSPSGGDASISGIYSELDTPGTYTVEASNSACTAELNINLDEFECNVPGDFNHDGIVNIADLIAFNIVFGTSCSGCPQDFNQNGLVDSQDQITMLSLLGLTWQTHCGF